MGAGIAAGETDYTMEKELLVKCTKVMGGYADGMSQTQDLDEMARLAAKLTKELRPLLPDLIKMMKAHPEWADDPPAEIKETLDDYLGANVRMSRAFSRLTKNVNANQDNLRLNEAFAELNKLFYELRKGEGDA